jgi:hypothetical protein
VLLEPSGDFLFYSFIVGKMFSRKIMFKRAEQTEVVVAMEREVTARFRQHPKEFYADSFQGLIERWDKDLSVQGDYVEK